MSSADDFIDLLSSGDEQKIKCVLLPTMGGAIGSALVFSGTGIGAAIAAVFGGLAAYTAAYNMCGAETTKGRINQMFSATQLPKAVVEQYENDLVRDYGLSNVQCRYVTQAAMIYLRTGGLIPQKSPSQIAQKNGVYELLRYAGLSQLRKA